MTRARCAVLSHLAQHEGVNQVTLARILDIAPISLARLIHPLEADGLVARMHDPDDRRAHVLTLTTKALPIIEQISDLTRNTYDDLQLGMSEAETSQLCAFLCRLRSKLTGRRQEDS
jgi:DNA-binding MarR family transcriptional regulator